MVTSYRLQKVEYPKSEQEAAQSLRCALGRRAPWFDLVWDTRRRQWVVSCADGAFGFTTLGEAVDVLGTALDMAGGDVGEFVRILRPFELEMNTRASAARERW